MGADDAPALWHAHPGLALPIDPVDGQKWRTGSQGRISVVKRRHGLDRCRYKSLIRWGGLGIIANNVANIGRAMERQAAP